VPFYIRPARPAGGRTPQDEPMVEHKPISTTTPPFSIIIAVYNDWVALGACLGSLAQQMQGPGFEVIVVDDGSAEAAPEVIRQWVSCLPLTIVRQPHGGIPTARNHGIKISRGSVLLFVDADCRFHRNCLTALESTIAASPEHNCFQLRLRGDCSRSVGRAEELRLTTLQNHTLQPDGCIRYLNTAGFAIRRSSVEIEKGLFDPVALRAEDTLLLANLMERGILPFFVADAIIQHDIPLSLLECLRKDIRSAYLEGRTYDLISSKGIRIRMSHRERLSMLWSAWKASGQPSIGRSGWFVLTVRQALQRIVSFGFGFLRIRPKARVSTNPS
jgi:glycosyltransferase involved in cell wall biosynthesis